MSTLRTKTIHAALVPRLKDLASKNRKVTIQYGRLQNEVVLDEHDQPCMVHFGGETKEVIDAKFINDWFSPVIGRRGDPLPHYTIEDILKHMFVDVTLNDYRDF